MSHSRRGYPATTFWRYSRPELFCRRYAQRRAGISLDCFACLRLPGKHNDLHDAPGFNWHNGDNKMADFTAERPWSMDIGAAGPIGSPETLAARDPALLPIAQQIRSLIDLVPQASEVELDQGTLQFAWDGTGVSLVVEEAHDRVYAFIDMGPPPPQDTARWLRRMLEANMFTFARGGESLTLDADRDELVLCSMLPLSQLDAELLLTALSCWSTQARALKDLVDSDQPVVEAFEQAFEALRQSGTANEAAWPLARGADASMMVR